MKSHHFWPALQSGAAIIVGLLYGLNNAGSHATEGGRNPVPSGILGIQVGNMPPPGFYVSAEPVYIHADRFNGSSGARLFPNFKLDGVGMAPRLLWNTGEK